MSAICGVCGAESPTMMHACARLAGQLADKTLPAGTAPQVEPVVTETGAARVWEDPVRSGLVVESVTLLQSLPLDELKRTVQRLKGRTVALVWGERMRLRPKRDAVTRSADVGGMKVHLGTNLDDAGEVRTVWIDVAKEGSPVRGLLHVVAGLASIALQHGAPVASVAKIMSEPEFDPAGAVTEACEEDGITSAKSIPHYIAQVLMLGREGGR